MRIGQDADQYSRLAAGLSAPMAENAARDVFAVETTRALRNKRPVSATRRGPRRAQVRPRKRTGPEPGPVEGSTSYRVT